MNLLLIASTLASLQVERATAPSFRVEGEGKLVVLEVPETVSLAFFVVQCARATDAGTRQVSSKVSVTPIEAGKLFLSSLLLASAAFAVRAR